MKTTKCDKCGEEVRNCNFKKHYNSCKREGVKKRLLECPHCKKTWKELNVKRNEKGNHARWCLLNPKLQEYKDNLKSRDMISLMRSAKILKYGQIGWNKGQTKETNQNIKKTGENLSKRYKNGELVGIWKNRNLSKEHKNKISSGIKKAHSEGRHPGYSFINKDPNRMSYPEKYIKECFVNEGLFNLFKIEIHKPIGKYFLDFSFSDLKVDFEVDSRYHISSKEAIEHDIERNNFLIKNGWKVYRIFWKSFLKNPKEEIRKFVNYLNEKEKVDLVTYELKI